MVENPVSREPLKSSDLFNTMRELHPSPKMLRIIEEVEREMTAERFPFEDN